MLDKILALVVVILLFIEVLLKIKIGKYIEDKDNIRIFEFYINIILQLLAEAGAMLICFIRSYLPEATVSSNILLFVIFILVAYNLYKNYSRYQQIRNILKKYKK